MCGRKEKKKHMRAGAKKIKMSQFFSKNITNFQAFFSVFITIISQTLLTLANVIFLVNHENFRRDKFSVENLTEGFFAENMPFTKCDRKFVTPKILEK